MRKILSTEYISVPKILCNNCHHKFKVLSNQIISAVTKAWLSNTAQKMEVYVYKMRRISIPCVESNLLIFKVWRTALDWTK